MTNVQFRQGLKAQLPQVAPEGDLLFTTDTGEIYKGTGSGIKSLGSVLTGFADLNALNQLTEKIQGKIYLTGEYKLYAFNGTDFVPLVADSDAVSAVNVSFDNTDSGLSSTNVQEALKALADRTEAESTGEIKLNDADTLGYLGNKLDATLAVENGTLKAKSIEGLTLTGAQIQSLLGTATGDIQTQINNIATGINYVGSFATLALLEAETASKGDLAVVTEDGSQLYIYSGTAWQNIGKFEFAENFIGLKDTPSGYENGKFLKSSASGVVYGDIVYADVTDAPDLTELEQAITEMHTHANKATLDKLGEADGALTYDGVKVTPQWGTFE